MCVYVCMYYLYISFLCKFVCHSECDMQSIWAALRDLRASWMFLSTHGFWLGNVRIIDLSAVSSASFLINPTTASVNISMVDYLGRNCLSGPNPNEVNRTVVNITCHPGFNSSTRENDICLLKLSAPVNFTDYIQPICLGSENSTFNNESRSWAIGFGINMQEGNLPIVGNNVCRSSHPRQHHLLGATLMTQSGSIWLQSGVHVAAGCFELPSVYTPVSQYQKWISDTVTGTPPGFVTFPSPHSSLQTTAPPTAPPTTPTAPPTTSTTSPTSPTCVGVFCSAENMIHFTHFTSLCVLVVLLHVFAGTVGN
ncbi:hypothetical protein ACER0C_003527 [Sarotherodon galilaeus]